MYHNPQIQADRHILAICRQILEQERSLEEWAAAEQTTLAQGLYKGSFDESFNAFVFSFMMEEDQEWWFRLSLELVETISQGQETWLDVFESYEEMKGA